MAGLWPEQDIFFCSFRRLNILSITHTHINAKEGEEGRESEIETKGRNRESRRVRQRDGRKEIAPTNGYKPGKPTKCLSRQDLFDIF